MAHVSVDDQAAAGSTRRWRTQVAVGALFLLALILGYGTPSRAAGADDVLGEEVVELESRGVTVHGAVLVPYEASSPDRKPAIALVHGAGPLGIVLADDPATPGRLVPIALIVAGIVALRLFSAA
jgi:hypothetical protein